MGRGYAFWRSVRQRSRGSKDSDGFSRDKAKKYKRKTDIEYIGKSVGQLGSIPDDWICCLCFCYAD